MRVIRCCPNKWSLLGKKKGDIPFRELENVEWHVLFVIVQARECAHFRLFFYLPRYKYSEKQANEGANDYDTAIMEMYLKLPRASAAN